MLPYTTFKRLRSENACADRYKHLKRCCNGVGDDEPIELITVLKHNGISDVLWVPENIVTGTLLPKRYRLFTVACCQDILHLMKDQRSIEAVRVSHLFAHNEDNKTSLNAAMAAAWNAARDAERDAARDAAGDAARDAARAAEGVAAWTTAEDAAIAAARAAAWAAAGVAAWTTAWAEARDAAKKRQADYFRIIFGTYYV